MMKKASLCPEDITAITADIRPVRGARIAMDAQWTVNPVSHWRSHDHLSDASRRQVAATFFLHSYSDTSRGEKVHRQEPST